MGTQYINNIDEIYQEYFFDSNEKSLNVLMDACKGLVYHYAKLYGGGYCFEDIRQSGYEGLLKAIRNFDIKKNIKFSTYSSHYIIGEIRHFVRKERKYYYPMYLEVYQEKLDNIIVSNLDKRDEPVSNDELAGMLNLQPEAILPMMSAGLIHFGCLEVSSIKTKEPESFTLSVEDKLLLSQLIYHLTGIQKDVIERLFHKEMTQAEVAKELGLTQKQVSRIKLKSLQKMRGLTGE